MSNSPIVNSPPYQTKLSHAGFSASADAVRRLRETTLPPELKEKLRAFLKRSAQP